MAVPMLMKARMAQPAQGGAVMRAVKNAGMLGRDVQGAMGRRMKLNDALQKMQRVK